MVTAIVGKFLNSPPLARNALITKVSGASTTTLLFDAENSSSEIFPYRLTGGSLKAMCP
jgi:hypothetical protein